MAEAARPLAAGERVGSYQILGLAGSGGMGVVYKALDVKLERTVALKFLPHELGVGEKDKERFLREAKAASTLDHPNVGVIYGVEETPDGQLFIVMAYYEGETLAQKIRSGPLPASQAVDIAMQMARGLAEAHRHRIVHRDIKPSNVIVTSQNVAKIVDFGLARVIATASMTQSQSVSGTVVYMSPEQTLAKPVDQRSDIWALGVVLAEMLTGRNPFLQETPSATLFAILSHPPALPEGLPVELQQVIYHALSKDPAGRYASCQELLGELEAIRGRMSAPRQPGEVDAAAPTRSLAPKELQKYVEQASSSAWSGTAPRRAGWQWWLVGVAALSVMLAGLSQVPSIRQRIAERLGGGTEKHIAVLPFDNIGNDPANAPVAEGLMDSLTSRLSNLEVGEQSLWVVPASVVRGRKIQDPTAAQRELGATLVVKGSIQREGQDVHLTVNLINTKNLRQIGSVAVEDRAGDLATLQDEAVARLARLMNINLTAEMLRSTGGSVNPAAYESYLKALGYIQRYDKPGNLDLAITALEGATKTDPRFAVGFAELGEAYRLKFQLGRDPKWIEEVSANCSHAVQLDDRLPVAYVTLARLHTTLGKNDLAMGEFNHALQLDPHNADALIGVAGAYERLGRIADAEATFKRGAALRPDYWDGYNSLGLFYQRHGRHAEAVPEFQHVLELAPDNTAAYINLGVAYLNLDKPTEAEAALRKSIELSPSYAAYANLGTLYYDQKRFGESAAMTEKALAINDKDYRVWANLKVAYQWLKEKDKVSAASEHEMGLVEALVKGAPEDGVAQSELASLYAEQGQRDKALTRIQSALALAPDDPNVLVNAGEVYEISGNRAQALRYVEKALLKGMPLGGLTSDPNLQDLFRDPNFHPKGK